MERTSKNDGGNRDLIIKFRATANEIMQLKEYARRERITLSEFIRRRLDRKQEGTDRQDFIRLLAEIGKQGSNLNQMTKAMNIWVKTGNDPKIEPDTLCNCIFEVSRITKELLEIIKNGSRRKNQR